MDPETKTPESGDKGKKLRGSLSRGVVTVLSILVTLVVGLVSACEITRG